MIEVLTVLNIVLVIIYVLMQALMSNACNTILN